MSRILRDRRRNPFVQIDRQLMQDQNLTFAARGLVGYILSLPADWELNMADLSNRSPQGKSAIRSMMHELMQAGYVTRNRTADSKGRFSGYEYVVHEIAVGKELRTNPKKGKTVIRLSDDGQTDNRKTDIQKTDTNIEDSTEDKHLKDKQAKALHGTREETDDLSEEIDNAPSRPDAPPTPRSARPPSPAPLAELYDTPDERERYRLKHMAYFTETDEGRSVWQEIRTEIGAKDGELITPYAPLHWMFYDSRLELHHLTARTGIRKRILNPARTALRNERTVTTNLSKTSTYAKSNNRPSATDAYKPKDNPRQYEYGNLKGFA